MTLIHVRGLRTALAWVAAAGLAVGGCAGEAGSEAEPAPPPPPAAAESAAAAEAPDTSAGRGAETAEPNPLMNPSAPEMNMMAPADFRVRLVTSKGDVVLEIHRDWAPNGADRFFNLVRNGFFDGARFFRVLEGFVAQFGINGDPRIQARWRSAAISDDPVVESNTRGRLTFATRGPNTRTTQMFINLEDNSGLDSQGFAPIGEVIEGMDVVESLYSGYGEGPPRGTGPDQSRIQIEGNAYLERAFPNLDVIERAEIVS